MRVIDGSISGSKFMEEGGTTRNLNLIHIFNLFLLITSLKVCKVSLQGFQERHVGWQRQSGVYIFEKSA